MLQGISNIIDHLRSKPASVFWMIVIINVIFRAFGTDASSIYLDEGQTMFQAKRTITEIIEDYVLKQQNAPLYFLLTHFWIKIFGLSVFSIRFLSVVMMALAGGFFFKFTKKLVSFNFAILCSILFLGVNDFMHYAHEARGYALIAFLSTASFYSLYSLLISGERKWAIYLAITGIALLYTHYLTIYIFAVQGASVFIHLLLFRNYNSFVKYVVSQLVVALLFAPWLGVVFSVMPEKGDFWIAEPTWNLLKNNYYYMINGKLKTHWFFVVLSVLFLVRFFIPENRNNQKIFNFILLFLWAFVPVIANYFIGFHIPVFLAKYTFYASLGFTLLAAYLLYTSLGSPKTGTILVLAMAFFAFSSLKWESNKGESWKEAVAYIKNLKKEETLVIGQRFYTYKAFFIYYDINFFKSTNQPYIQGEAQNIYFREDVEGTEQLLTKKSPKHIIYYRAHWKGNDREGKVKSLLDSKYSLVSEKKYTYRENKETIGVYEYRLP